MKRFIRDEQVSSKQYVEDMSYNLEDKYFQDKIFIDSLIKFYWIWRMIFICQNRHKSFPHQRFVLLPSHDCFNRVFLFYLE